MKKLICEKDIKTLIETGKTCCEVEKDTLITPSARDAAEAAGITFYCETMLTEKAQPANSEITSELVLRAIKGLIERGLLPPDFCENLIIGPAPYVCEKEPGGFKVVRGSSIRMNEFFPGNHRVRYQEVIDKSDSSISSGILEIDHDTYKWTQNYDENDYVLEGELTIKINEKEYIACRGDCVFIPKGASVIMGSKDAYCKIFYSIYPFNWSDLK